MRLLRLTNSQDVDRAIAEGQGKAAIADRILAEAAGEPVETTIRIIWPDPPLPDLIDGWLHRYEPDMVLLTVSSYWFTYVSMPVRVERNFGPIGKPLARAGLRAAATPWLAYNVGFRTLRRAALATIGGSTYFTPDQVVSLMEACIRGILAHEEITLVVRGPRSPFAAEGNARAKRRAEELRVKVHKRMADLCRELHVEYTGWDSAAAPQDVSDRYQGDLVHMTPAVHAEVGEMEAEALVRAWQATHPAVPTTPS